MRAVGKKLVVKVVTRPMSKRIHVAQKSFEEQLEESRGQPLEGEIVHLGAALRIGDAQAWKSGWLPEGESEMNVGDRICFWPHGSCRVNDLEEPLMVVEYGSIQCVLDKKDIKSREDVINRMGQAAKVPAGSPIKMFETSEAEVSGDDMVNAAGDVVPPKEE